MLNTPGVNRTLNLRIWNPLLYLIELLAFRCSDRAAHKEQRLLTLDFVQRVLAQARAVLLQLGRAGALELHLAEGEGLVEREQGEGQEEQAHADL